MFLFFDAFCLLSLLRWFPFCGHGFSSFCCYRLVCFEMCLSFLVCCCCCFFFSMWLLFFSLFFVDLFLLTFVCCFCCLFPSCLLLFCYCFAFVWFAPTHILTYTHAHKHACTQTHRSCAWCVRVVICVTMVCAFTFVVCLFYFFCYCCCLSVLFFLLLLFATLYLLPFFYCSFSFVKIYTHAYMHMYTHARIQVVCLVVVGMSCVRSWPGALVPWFVCLLLFVWLFFASLCLLTFVLLFVCSERKRG